MTDILPGVFITVKAEGLIVAGPISTGNIGIVGTAKKGTDLEVVRLSSYDEAQEKFGTYDAFDPKKAVDPNKTVEEFTLVRALEIAYANGASSVYAVKVAGTSDTDYEKGLEKLANEDVQIVVAAGKGYGIGRRIWANYYQAHRGLCP